MRVPSRSPAQSQRQAEATVTIAGNPFRLKAGEAIVMPANRPHSLGAVTPFKMALRMIRSPA